MVNLLVSSINGRHVGLDTLDIWVCSSIWLCFPTFYILFSRLLRQFPAFLMVHKATTGGNTKDTTRKSQIGTGPFEDSLPVCLKLTFLHTQQLDAGAFFLIWNAHIKHQDAGIGLRDVPVALSVDIMRRHSVLIAVRYGEILLSSKFLSQPPAFVGVTISNFSCGVYICSRLIVILCSRPNLIHLWGFTLGVIKFCHADCALTVFLSFL